MTKDVEPYSIVAGNPAKFVRKRFDEETIQKLLALKWWEWSDEKLDKYSEMFCDTKEFLSKVEN